MFFIDTDALLPPFFLGAAGAGCCFFVLLPPPPLSLLEPQPAATRASARTEAVRARSLIMGRSVASAAPPGAPGAPSARAGGSRPGPRRPSGRRRGPLR